MYLPKTLILTKIAGYCSDAVLRAHTAILDAAQKSIPLGWKMVRAQSPRGTAQGLQKRAEVPM